MSDKKSLRADDYIEHIITAIMRIEGYIKDLDQAAFIENSLVQDAVLRNIEIIGEAANNIMTVDENFVRKHPGLRLEQAYRMRNALAYGYYTVNLRTVWNTLQDDLPVLKEQMIQLRGPAAKDESE